MSNKISLIIIIIIIIIMAIYKAPVSAACDAHGASLHNNHITYFKSWVYKQAKKKSYDDVKIIMLCIVAYLYCSLGVSECISSFSPLPFPHILECLSKFSSFWNRTWHDIHCQSATLTPGFISATAVSEGVPTSLSWPTFLSSWTTISSETAIEILV